MFVCELGWQLWFSLISRVATVLQKENSFLCIECTKKKLSAVCLCKQRNPFVSVSSGRGSFEAFLLPETRPCRAPKQYILLQTFLDLIRFYLRTCPSPSFCLCNIVLEESLNSICQGLCKIVCVRFVVPHDLICSVLSCLCSGDPVLELLPRLGSSQRNHLFFTKHKNTWYLTQKPLLSTQKHIFGVQELLSIFGTLNTSPAQRC